MSQVTMYTGDLLPDLVVTLSASDGVPIDDALSVRVVGKSAGEILFDRAPISLEESGEDAVVTMQWQPEDTEVPRVIKVEVEVTWPGDKKQTYRAKNSIKVDADFDL